MAKISKKFSKKLNKLQKEVLDLNFWSPSHMISFVLGTIFGLLFWLLIFLQIYLKI